MSGNKESKGAFKHRYGPWAVVTGASEGIGKACALELARYGVNLVLVARRRALLEPLAVAIGREHAVQCRIIQSDLATAHGTDHVLDGTADLDVGLAILAAGFGTSGCVLETDIRDEVELVTVNCLAVMKLAHGYAGRLALRGRGGLVLMSSIVAFQGVPRAANYAASKAYVQSLAEALKVELRDHGVDVLASAPGPVASGFAKRANMILGQAASPDDVARGTLRAMRSGGVVRPGLLSKFLGWSLATAPRRLRVQIMAAIMRGMTAHQLQDQRLD